MGGILALPYYSHRGLCASMGDCGGRAVFERFLGRLPKVDLIILEGGGMSVRTCVRPNVRPSTKSFFGFNEIWYLGRGR